MTEHASQVFSGPHRRIAIVTGSRAEYGLLRPVLRAVAARPELQLHVIAAGAHLLPPAETVEEVRAEFDIAATVPMQQPAPEDSRAHDRAARLDDARALGRGITGFADAFARLAPDWVVLLGDRIEALAAASAASVGGIPVAHIHGGDRAEGVADEAMRHAITKLAHLHLASTPQSAERLARMGEPDWRIHTVGSPAMDGLANIGPLDDETFAELGAPEAIFLMHPIGRTEAEEHAAAAAALGAIAAANLRLLALHPNHDPGRSGILRAITGAAVRTGCAVHIEPHLARPRFLALLRRVRLLIGNSSAGLIEAAAVGGTGCAAVDIGDRQSGRERAGSIVHAGEEETAIRAAIERALTLQPPFAHPYGDGCAGERIAEILASIDPRGERLLRKHNSY